MKKSLKLTNLSKEILSPEELKHVIGGGESDGDCSCGCCYTDCGGSSVGDNLNANDDGGGLSSSCPRPCP